jgi:hypothetical protein
MRRGEDGKRKEEKRKKNKSDGEKRETEMKRQWREESEQK